MKHRLASVLVAGILLAACGTTGATSLPSASSQSAGASPSPVVKTIRLLYTTNVDNSAGGTTDLHEVTLSGGTVSKDSTVLSNKLLGLIDARGDIALVSLQIPISPTSGYYSELATVNLQTGQIADLGIRGDYGLSAVLSPDATQAVVAKLEDNNQDQFLIVELASKASRQLHISTAVVQRPQPVRWTNSGILVTSSSFDGPPGGLYVANPQTGDVQPMSTDAFESLSPSQRYQSWSSYTDLGDDPCNCQGNWSNTLNLRHIGDSSYSVIASEKNRDFTPVDVSDAGDVLYTTDSGAELYTSSSSDSGLYYYTGGKKIRQFQQRTNGQWGSGKLIDQVTAVTTQIQSSTTSELDLITLCTTDSGCSPKLTKIAAATGNSPSIGFVLLPQ